MRIFLIRHGESIGNAKGIHQGQKNDFPLSELGKEQANSLKKRFENLDVNAIYSSDLIRAKETAEIISESKDITPILDKRLRERDFGVIGEEEDIIKGWNLFLKQQVEKGINSWEAIPIGGESDKNHFERINSFFEDIKKNHHEKDTILIVAHGGTNKVVFGVIDHSSLDEMYKIPQGNTCVNELIFENGKWKVEKLNCIDHLDINPSVIKEFEKIRDEPLDVINNRCWEKSFRLKEVLENLGYGVKLKVCSFKWSEQNITKEILDMPHQDLDYHVYLIVKANGLKLIVDASNDSLLPKYNIWCGKNNCDLCVIPENFVEENIEKIFDEKIHEKYSDNQRVFLEKINSFFGELRKNKTIFGDEKE